MKNTTVSSAFSLIFGAALLGAAGSAFAASDVQIAPERVMAYDNYYIFGRAAIDDLDALETAVRVVRPKGIQLSACGADATQALKAAVHRFRDLPLQVQVLSMSAPVCEVAVSRHASQRRIPMPTGISDSAVDEYWRQVMP